MRTLTCPPESITVGANIRAFIDNLSREETRPFVEKHGLMGITPDDWFPTQRYLDLLNDMAANTPITSSLVAIGIEVGLMTPFPESMEGATLEDVLYSWDDSYQMLHRDADVGGISIEKVDDQHFKTIHTVVYPDDMSYGILYGYCRRFLPEGTSFYVYYDEEHPPRDRGGEGPTIIHVMWE